MKIVIVGGGFAGVQTALSLADQAGIEVRLISDKTYFEYFAALYRSATGRSPFEVAIPLADIFAPYSNVEIVEDKIISLDANKHTITGQTESVYHYDALVIALGSVTAYFGIQGLKEYSFGVKSVHDALELKNHIHDCVLKGEIGEKHFVIIGAGATGIEVAGELRAFANRTRRKHHLPKFNFYVDLVEAAPKILPSLPERFSQKITTRLKQLGVTLHLNTKVLAETFDSLELPTGNLKSQTVVWTAGVSNNPFFSQYPDIFPLDKKGKVLVNSQLEAHPDIYVLGDSANTQYSGMAQTALHDAKFVAKIIKIKSKFARKNQLHNNNSDSSKANPLQKLPSYVPKKPAYAIPVGPYWGAVQIGKFQFFGFFGWLLRRMIDLKLYLTFLPMRKSLLTFKQGFEYESNCKSCNSR